MRSLTCVRVVTLPAVSKLWRVQAKMAVAAGWVPATGITPFLRRMLSVWLPVASNFCHVQLPRTELMVL